MLGELEIQAIWLIIGTIAQVTILTCLVIHLWMSRRQKRMVLPSSLIYVCLLASGVLAVYAASRHDFIFVSSQIVNVVIGLRILGSRYEGAEPRPREFPDVAPDRADADL